MKNRMQFEVWAPNAVWKDFAEKKIIKSKQGALSYMRWLRVKYGHLARMALSIKSGETAVTLMSTAMRDAWGTFMGQRPKWLAMGPPPTSWAT